VGVLSCAGAVCMCDQVPTLNAFAGQRKQQNKADCRPSGPGEEGSVAKNNLLRGLDKFGEI
jgi:hypothetical protein